jgi:hypothetical protein
VETPAEVEIAFAWCAACAREVLTHGDYDAEGRERRLCVHCDGPAAVEQRAVRLGDLDAEGYALVEEQGCGRPDCGGGRCGR